MVFRYYIFKWLGLMLLAPFLLLHAAETTMGADVVNRYVWRGADYGNATAVQPYIECSVGSFTFGAWSSWALNGAEGGNENDLYVSTQIGQVELTLTDYFFPEYSGTDSLFNLDKHVLEATASTDLGSVSVLTAANLTGDDDNSVYIELGYGSLSLGLGNGFYSTNGNFAPVNFGISTSRDNLSASLIFNPDQETSFLVFGYSF